MAILPVTQPLPSPEVDPDIAVFPVPARSEASRAAWKRVVFHRSFAGNRTICGFAVKIRGLWSVLPTPTRQAIAAELSDNHHRAPICEEAERTAARYFAQLATWVIAPITLRHIGREALAADCENEDAFSLGKAASFAHCTIGMDRSLDEELEGQIPARSCAYSACSYAASCAHYGQSPDIKLVIKAGSWCADALIAATTYNLITDPDGKPFPEAAWLCAFAEASINAATRFGRTDGLTFETFTGRSRR